jgi:hypothetical protein
MGADQAGDRGAPAAAIEQAKLKPRRASVVREAWDPLLDFFIAAWLGLLDRMAPPRETPIDRAIREGRRAAATVVPVARRAPAQIKRGRHTGAANRLSSSRNIASSLSLGCPTGPQTPGPQYGRIFYSDRDCREKAGRDIDDRVAEPGRAASLGAVDRHQPDPSSQNCPQPDFSRSCSAIRMPRK